MVVTWKKKCKRGTLEGESQVLQAAQKRDPFTFSPVTRQYIMLVSSVQTLVLSQELHYKCGKSMPGSSVADSGGTQAFRILLCPPKKVVTL